MQQPIRRLFKDGWDTAGWLLGGLARNGYWVDTSAKILDFGCGAGNLVYRFRDLGFDAYGFDIHDTVQLRDPQDRKFFAFAPQDAVTKFSMEVDPDLGRTPFADDTFDIVVSTSVLEHVLNPDAFMAETARVLKPDGLAIHVFPRRASLIEPHMYVPLATRKAFQNWWWLYLWAGLGCRSDHQPDRTARDVAEMNLEYCRNGISYRPPRELIWIAKRHFGEADIVSNQWHTASDKSWNWRIYRNYRDAFRQWPFWKALATMQLLDVLMTREKRSEPAAPTPRPTLWSILRERLFSKQPAG